MSETNHHDEHSAQKAEQRPKIVRDNKYWLSLEHYYQDPEFLAKAETEFMSSPLREGEEEGKDPWARRDFLKLMGASIAMATSGCIRRPVQKIVPYNKQPEEVTLGVSNFYTSTYFDGSEGLGLLVKTREGRPIKIEGNPSFPLNKGGLSARSQASILGLYDPERLKAPQKNIFNEKKTNKDSIGVKWEEMDDAIAAQLKKGGVRVLTGAMASPSTRSIVSEFCQAFNAEHIVWEPLSHEELREGQKLSYGDDTVPQYRFDKAKMIVSIDADFLGAWLTPVTFTRQFSQTRKDLTKISRLVVFDSNYSLTGGNADIRVRIKPSQQIDVVMALINEIIGKSSYSGNSTVRGVLNNYSQPVAKLGIDPALIKEVAKDLWENRGQSLVVAGGLPTATSWGKDLQVAVNFLNSMLDNDGKTIEGKNGNPSLRGSYSEIFKLSKEMKEGKVKTLIIHRTNPSYVLAESVGFQEGLKKVEMVIYTGDRMDETGKSANFVIPDNHPLESWGDAEFTNNVFSIHQPTIRAMYDTRSFQLSLMTWAFLAKQGPKRLLAYETYYDYLKNYWREEIYPQWSGGKSFEDFWVKVLHEGFVGNFDKNASARSFRMDAFADIRPVSSKSGYELVLYPTIQLGDGQQANVSWLHELPDPVTKIVWDNYVSVSIATAEKLGLKEATVVELTIDNKTIELPVHIQPGLHDDVMAVAVGYGRTAAGKVANAIGQNAYHLASWAGDKVIFSGQSVQLKKLTKKYTLACVQAHHTMEGRQIVVEASAEDYRKKKGANIHRHHTWSIWSGHQYNGNKWGMAVDLNSCTGCSACMTACQSENNIPVVGKKYVLQGREMHWLRVDRYYTGSPTDAHAVYQPVMCQHCDNAPCETVCPVLATVHTDDGLNAMVYNRCVGTRYCSNNCPYKVRRFNWFNYTKQFESPSNMALNPDVTVRIRGVMEKCTFCVQRIKEAKSVARLENRSVRDGEIKTACQTACPADVIVFGDMNDPNSRVSQMFQEERAYALLEEWHAAPSVRYLTKIRNNGKETPAHNEHGANKGEHS